ncbi:MAG: hypothetical protein MUC59_04410 [Saprospiraceae bacterium]|jgi:hypothetical protein|nr:hypothetical protein [Saprospiraceae bacterium]
MKKIMLFSLLALFFTAAFTNDAMAQKKGKKKSSKTDEYFDESGFANKLWYGGNFILNVTGGNNESQFSIGLTPMVGYKLLGEYLSTGPRAGLVFNSFRVRFGNTVYKGSATSYTLGWFARVKPLPEVLPNIFAHFEYEHENVGIPVDLNSSGGIDIERFGFNNQYIGLGYNSTAGGLWGYEIMGLYNVNLPDDSAASPVSFRFGLTYKF